MRTVNRASTVLLLFIVLLLHGCSLFGPREDKIADWIKIPDPGTVYNYDVVTTWFDGGETENTDTFKIAAVEEIEPLTKIKLINPETSESCFYIINNENGYLLKSDDAEIGDDDTMLLKIPVAERANWEHGSAYYKIDKINQETTLNDKKIKDCVIIEMFPDDHPNIDITITWSIEYGLIEWMEEYDADSSYIKEYSSSLVSAN